MRTRSRRLRPRSTRTIPVRSISLHQGERTVGLFFAHTMAMRAFGMTKVQSRRNGTRVTSAPGATHFHRLPAEDCDTQRSGPKTTSACLKVHIGWVDPFLGRQPLKFCRKGQNRWAESVVGTQCLCRSDKTSLIQPAQTSGCGATPSSSVLCFPGKPVHHGAVEPSINASTPFRNGHRLRSRQWPYRRPSDPAVAAENGLRTRHAEGRLRGCTETLPL